MTPTGHNLHAALILFGLTLGSGSSGVQADWSPGPPDCREQGLSCDDAGLAALSRLERDHTCSCNPDPITGGQDADEEEGCSCSTPGHSRRELPLSLVVLGLAAAGGALWRDRRR